MKPPANLVYDVLVGEERERFDRFFNKVNSLIEVNPGNVVMPYDYIKIGNDILNLPIYETDVWLCSCPRTGSTWAQELVWLVGHDLDYAKAKDLQQIRCPIVELTALMSHHHGEWHDEAIEGTSVDLVRDRVAHPRYLRSHLPWGLLPKNFIRDDGSLKAKIIYVARNPKDMCVSFYHYCLLVHNINATFEEFCEVVLDGRGIFGHVWKHILGFWDKRDDPNMMFVKFEELKKDLAGVIRRTATFLDKDMSDKQVEELCDYLSFNNMKNNRAVNLEPIIEKSNGKEYLEKTDLRFIRKGEIGDWKNHMTPEMAARFDHWAVENLKGYDLTFE